MAVSVEEPLGFQFHGSSVSNSVALVRPETMRSSMAFTRFHGHCYAADAAAWYAATI